MIRKLCFQLHFATVLRERVVFLDFKIQDVPFNKQVTFKNGYNITLRAFFLRMTILFLLKIASSSSLTSLPGGNTPETH